MSADVLTKSEAVSLVPAALTAASEKKGAGVAGNSITHVQRGLTCPLSTAGGKR